MAAPLAIPTAFTHGRCPLPRNWTCVRLAQQAVPFRGRVRLSPDKILLDRVRRSNYGWSFTRPRRALNNARAREAVECAPIEDGKKSAWKIADTSTWTMSPVASVGGRARKLPRNGS